MTNMTDHTDELDALIDRFDITTKTGKTREELRKQMQKGMLCLNLAYCLADVIDALIFDTDAALLPFGATLEKKDKQLFNQLKRTLAQARQSARNLTREVHSKADKDGYQGEADWWYNIIRLIEDRTGDDKLKTKQVLDWLLTMPTKLDMFKVKKIHFQRTIE